MRFQTLPEWLSWLETLHPVAIELGLARVRVVAERLGVLAPGVPVVTVAGTNGKGSVTALLEALLRAHGLRTALYTSPHILRFNERIRVDGVDAADADIVAALAAVDAARGETSLTYFEFTTLAAFVLFRRAQLDVWVLEIGLGGRLDAVNLIDADVAVLTSVGLDHMEWLGPTREHIGREKAGIFRTGKPAVLGELAPPASVREVAASVQAPLLLAGEDFAITDHHGQLDWHGRDRTGAAVTYTALPRPALAAANVATAMQALNLLPFALRADALAAGLRSVQLPGRNQRLDVPGRAMVLDVGHNPDALRFLVAELPRHDIGMRFHVVLAMLADKDIAGAVRELEPLAQSWHIAPLSGARGAPVERLLAALPGSGPAPVHVYDEVAAAARGACASNDRLPVLAVGSFYTVAGVMAWIRP